MRRKQTINTESAEISSYNAIRKEEKEETARARKVCPPRQPSEKQTSPLVYTCRLIRSHRSIYAHAHVASVTEFLLAGAGAARNEFRRRAELYDDGRDRARLISFAARSFDYTLCMYRVAAIITECVYM